ncbi:MAG: exosome complex RNA-binding protein Csl4 [Thaumarchaeota archaeon]|jgi:exosome complex component CSL4|nr:exosome complex RNA-binding protein Csl4 [Nitrososphaerota archaeon]
MKESHSRLVLVGEPLATVEEFFPGDGTFEKDGVIYSTRVGKISVDKNRRALEVVELKPLLAPKPGFKIIGSVTGFSSHYASVKIFYMNGNRLSYEYSGLIGKESFGRSYPRFRTGSLRNYVRENDIVYGEIMSTVNVNLLDLSAKEYGVVKAYCSNCGSPLVLFKKYLTCPSCKTRENRKLSVFYDEPVEKLVARV